MSNKRFSKGKHSLWKDMKEGNFPDLLDDRNLPKEALEKGIEGAVIVQFIVEKDGRLTNINVIRGIGYGCNEEAIRLIEIMPDWNPGRQRGQPARVQFTLPIRFILE